MEKGRWRHGLKGMIGQSPFQGDDSRSSNSEGGGVSCIVNALQLEGGMRRGFCDVYHVFFVLVALSR